MRASRLGFFIPLTMVAAFVHAHTWQAQPGGLQTRWAAQVTPTNALPDYPRPQMLRKRWRNLNGLWSYVITDEQAAIPSRYEGEILVPYPLESALSGVKAIVKPDQRLWYRRSFVYRPAHRGHTLLHFGAVDWQATVYVNGREVGIHTGGYNSFDIDITQALKRGANELVVKVYDPTDQGPNPHGKQTLRRELDSGGGIFYTPSSGIWQTVWLESVPDSYIRELTLTPDVDAGLLRVQAKVSAADHDVIEATALSAGKVVSRATFSGSGDLPIPNAHVWSPDDPFLYDLEIKLIHKGRVLDRVRSYFGMRRIEIKRDDHGVERIFLNNRYTFNLGVLDQGFWPDGLYTAPSDEALKFDIQAVKAMGFNTIRKHIKVEPDRWYYWCDKLGMLVWQDMVTPGNASPEGKSQFEKSIEATVGQLRDHPSIVSWVVFNEGWNAYDQSRLTQVVRSLDPSRLVNGHTGEERWGDDPADDLHKWAYSDVTDIHPYPGPGIPPRQAGKAQVIGEFGGLGTVVDGHIWDDQNATGSPYANAAPDQLAERYTDLMKKVKEYEAQGLSGSIYTQTYDVEDEQNGLLTYDRAVTKIPLVLMREINGTIVSPTRNYAEVAKNLSLADANLAPAALRYAAALAEYERGNRELGFLRRLTIMAMAQKDEVHGAEAGALLLKAIEEKLREPEPASPGAAYARARLLATKNKLEPKIHAYGTLVAYRNGERDYSKTATLVGAAQTVGDEPLANAIAREYIENYADRLDQSVLLTKKVLEILGVIQEQLRLSDRAFQMIYHGAVEADGAMNEGGWSSRVTDDVVWNELVDPELKRLTSQAQNRGPDWAVFTDAIAAKLDATTADRVVLMAKQYWFSRKNDYVALARAYFERFDKYGLGPHEWPDVNTFNWGWVFYHVDDPAILAKAIKEQEVTLKEAPSDQARQERQNTYANLLYKAGRVSEAIQEEERAADAEDSDAAAERRQARRLFRETLEKMKSGTPTWLVP